MQCKLGSNLFIFLFLVFKQKTAYEMRISDWSSDVCSSDLCDIEFRQRECRIHDGFEREAVAIGHHEIQRLNQMPRMIGVDALQGDPFLAQHVRVDRPVGAGAAQPAEHLPSASTRTVEPRRNQVDTETGGTTGSEGGVRECRVRGAR